MKAVIKLYFICLFSLVTTSTHASGNSEQEYKRILEETISQINNAKEHQQLWRDTEKIVSVSEQYASKEDYQQAINALEKAKHQATRAIQQAEQQPSLDALIPYYLK